MKKYLSILLVCVLVVAFGVIASMGFSADTEKTIYISANGDASNDGLSADKPINTITAAYQKLGAEGGRIVITDTFTFNKPATGKDGYTPPVKHTGKVTISGLNSDSVLNIGASQRYYLAGHTEFDNIKIKAGNSITWFLVCSFNDLTITDTVKVERSASFLICAGSTAGVDYTVRNNTLTVNGGNWEEVIGAVRNHANGGSNTIAAHKDYHMTINIGGNAYINKFFAFGRSISLSPTPTEYIAKNSSCTVNLNGGTIGSYVGHHDVKGFPTGYENGITVNVGKDFDISKSFDVALSSLDENRWKKEVSGDKLNGYVYYGISGDCLWTRNALNKPIEFNLGQSTLNIAEEIYDEVIASKKVDVASFKAVNKIAADTPETTAPETTAAPTTTAAPETTVAPTTTAAPETTAAPTTTAAPETTAAASDSSASSGENQPEDNPETLDMIWVVALATAISAIACVIVIAKKREN